MFLLTIVWHAYYDVTLTKCWKFLDLNIGEQHLWSIVLFSVRAHGRQRPEIWYCPCTCARCQRSL